MTTTARRTSRSAATGSSTSSLQETRVVIAGVQFLVAFLLAVAFQQGFAKTTDFQRDVFLATMICSSFAAMCFIAPASWHRILFEHHDKRHIIKVAHRFLISGLIFLNAAMTLVLVLVCDYVFDGVLVRRALPAA